MSKKQLFISLIFFTLLITSIYSTIVIADDLPIPRDYIHDVGEDYVFVMLSPYDPSAWVSDIRDEIIRGTYSNSGLYTKGNSPALIWTVDWYAYESEIEISLDGRYLLRWEIILSYAKSNSIALRLYESGREVREFAINDLVTFPFLLPAPVAWKENSFLDNDQDLLWIRTSNGEEYTIELATGKILKGTTPMTKIALLIFGMSFLIFILYLIARRVFGLLVIRREK